MLAAGVSGGSFLFFGTMGVITNGRLIFADEGVARGVPPAEALW
jgi:hypothetical protein